MKKMMKNMPKTMKEMAKQMNDMADMMVGNMGGEKKDMMKGKPKMKKKM